MSEKKALIAMSGGVDSSVAAAMMIEAGYQCIGVTMKLYDNADIGLSKGHTCCSLDDVEDARSVASELEMPYYVMDFSEDFEEKVVDRFIRSYEEGATPNPCIDCNRFMKFEKLYQRARELACDVIVTGHYARSGFDEERGRWVLKKSRNQAKDQSYVLCFMTQDQLAHTMFPLGESSSKDEVRQEADKYGFINAKKHDSQDICFVPDGDYASFITRHTGKTYPEGDFVGPDGAVLGKHKGIIRYTIGQRKGLGLSLPAPLYVKGKDMDKNAVLLGDHASLFSKRLIAEEMNWISIAPPPEGSEIRISAKPRYRAAEAPAVARVLPDGRVEIVFDEPQRALTVGQAVCLYDGEYVVGGGTICET